MRTSSNSSSIAAGLSGSPTRFSSSALVPLLGLFAIVIPGCFGATPVPGAADEPAVIRLDVGFNVPESVVHDVVADLYLVSNINGSPFGEDGVGYVSRYRPDGTLESGKWIDGSKPGVALNAPKGMAIVGDVLYVADVTTVRTFDRVTGAPRATIDIAGVTFLNDLASAEDGTVYASDTGLKAGFVPSGTDAIYALTPAGRIEKIAGGDALAQPNGLLVDGDELLVVSWAGGTLSAVSRDGELRQIARLPAKQLDGIVSNGDGLYLISSWEGKCVYGVGKGGVATTVIGGLDAPADLGWDAKRKTLLVPLFQSNRLLIVR